MELRLDIKLSKSEIREAIVQYAIQKIDLGVPFSDDDISLYSLNLETANLDITPGRGNDTTF